MEGRERYPIGGGLTQLEVDVLLVCMMLGIAVVVCGPMKVVDLAGAFVDAALDRIVMVVDV